MDEWKWEETGDAVLAYGALVVTLLIGQSGFLGQFKGGDLPYFVSLAACTIYVGSHRALTSKARQNISLGQGALARRRGVGQALGTVHLPWVHVTPAIHLLKEQRWLSIDYPGMHTMVHASFSDLFA